VTIRNIKPGAMANRNNAFDLTFRLSFLLPQTNYDVLHMRYIASQLRYFVPHLALYTTAQQMHCISYYQNSSNIASFRNLAADLWTVLVPHSQCSLRENPKFLKNFRSKNNTLKETF
jgi:hypothetical protein